MLDRKGLVNDLDWLEQDAIDEMYKERTSKISAEICKAETELTSIKFDTLKEMYDAITKAMSPESEPYFVKRNCWIAIAMLKMCFELRMIDTATRHKYEKLIDEHLAKVQEATTQYS